MKLKNLLTSSLGNTLEWFDFGLFIFFAPIIGQKFFATHNNATATLLAYSILAAGFICRPLGGIIFGYYGDRFGRRKPLRYSILMITLTTLLVGLIPSYDSIGFSATLCFIALRLLQGLSIGGEYSGIMIYLAESAEDKKRGFFTSFAAIGANLGFLLATLFLMLLNFIFPTTIIENWAWRIPFVFIGILGILIFFFRLNLLETPSFKFLRLQHSIKTKPLLDALKFAPKKIITMLCLTCMGSTFYYFFFAYLPNFLNENYAFAKPNIVQALMLIAMLFLTPFAGFLGDRFDRKLILLITACSMIIFIVPSFYVLQQNHNFMFLGILIIGTCLSSFEQGTNLASIVENCPVDVRYSGVAFSYNLGNAIFGGTAPLIIAFLSQHFHPMTAAIYLAAMATISLLAIITIPSAKKLNFLVLSKKMQLP